MIDEKVKELQEFIGTTDLERLNYRLSDAIREGSQVSGQKVGNWCDEQGNLCAMSAAVLAARARGYMK